MSLTLLASIIFTSRYLSLLLPLSQVDSENPTLEKLEGLLEHHSFKDADEETLQIICKSIDTEKGCINLFFDKKSVAASKDYLRAIDTLWLKYSDGKYGFSVQRKIWNLKNGTIGSNINASMVDLFAKEVGWRLRYWGSNYECPREESPKLQGSLPCKSNLFFKFLTLGWMD